MLAAAWMSYAPRFGDTVRYGMLSNSLDIARAAATMADGALFTGMDASETRRIHEPRYRYAAFLAGLFSNLPLIASSTVEWNGDTWNPAVEPLSAFAERHGNISVLWQSPSLVKREAGIWIVSRYLPKASFDYIVEADFSILHAMLSAISPEKPASLLQQVVYKAIERVTSHNQSRSVVPTVGPTTNQAQDHAGGAQAPGTTQHLTNDQPQESMQHPAKPQLNTSSPAAHTDNSTATSTGIEKLWESMGPAAAGVLSAIVEDASNKPEIAAQIRRTNDGMEISTALLASYGVSGGAITAGLQKAGILKAKARTHLTLEIQAANLIFKGQP